MSRHPASFVWACFALRSTSDLDIGLAIESWDAHDNVVKRFPLSGSTGLRYRIAKILVDIMPFGAVEKPKGEIAPALRLNDPVSVFAFQEVFEHSDALLLPSGATIRIPTAAGYTALKLRAWNDRWTTQYETKDASDIAAAVYWYAEDKTVFSRLYETDEGIETLTGVDFDVSLAAAQLLGRDAMAVIGEARADELRSLWSKLDLDALANAFGSSDLPHWPADRARRRALVQALSDGVVAPS